MNFILKGKIQRDGDTNSELKELKLKRMLRRQTGYNFCDKCDLARCDTGVKNKNLGKFNDVI